MLRIGAWYFAVLLVHQLIEADLAARDRAIEGFGNLFCGVDHDADQRRIRRFHAAVGDQRDQPLGEFEQLGDAVIGALQIGRRQIDAFGEMTEFVDHPIAMREIGSRSLCNTVDLAADRRKAVLHAGNDAPDLGCTFAGVLGPQRGVAALADQVVDLAVQIP